MYYRSSENKGADQLRSYCEADLRLCFRICRLFGFPHEAAHITFADGEALNKNSARVSCNQSKGFVGTYYKCISGLKSVVLPSLQLLNLDGTKVRQDIQDLMATNCPRLTQVSLRNLEPYTLEDQEADAGNMEV